MRPGCCTVKVISTGHPDPTITSGVLVCFSLLDLGIEIVQVVNYEMDPKNYMLDGEIQNVEDEASQLVKMPIALVACDYLGTIFGDRNADLEYTDGRQPSIQMRQFHPREDKDKKISEIIIFPWDVEQRLMATKRKIGTAWQQKRFSKWDKLFHENFFTRNGVPSCGNASILFVPGTAKILNLYFSKLWKKEAKRE